MKFYTPQTQNLHFLCLQTEPSTWRVSSPRVESAVGNESKATTTHPLTDLTLQVAGRQWPKFSKIPFCLQLMDTPNFEVLYC